MATLEIESVRAIGSKVDHGRCARQARGQQATGDEGARVAIACVSGGKSDTLERGRWANQGSTVGAPWPQPRVGTKYAQTCQSGHDPPCTIRQLFKAVAVNVSIEAGELAAAANEV